jgi:RNA polymerase sigma factor (sigma-70 family)
VSGVEAGAAHVPSRATATAAEELFVRCHASLQRYLARYTGDADQAADIAQEAFVRMLEHAPDTSIARPWLFRVATNLAHDASRTARRRRELVLGGRALLTVSDPPAAPDARAGRDAARRMIETALAGLSDKERRALLMREEGFSHREIAAALETTTGSVGTLLARSLRKAAERLRHAQEAG